MQSRVTQPHKLDMACCHSALEDGREVLVNEAGEFALAPSDTACSLVQKQLSRSSDLYATFKAKQFITDDSSSPLLDQPATKYGTKYSFIEGFTKLHIFVVTLRCDHSCHYCQVSRQTAGKSTYDISLETAEKSVELTMKSPARHVTLELRWIGPDVVHLLNSDC